MSVTRKEYSQQTKIFRPYRYKTLELDILILLYHSIFKLASQVFKLFEIGRCGYKGDHCWEEYSFNYEFPSIRIVFPLHLLSAIHSSPKT